jgi:hypothetical protein
MYNDNPHYSFTDFDVFLNPDTGQANINCDKQKSDFNHMVFRTKTLAYYDPRLDASKPLEPRVELLHGANEEEVTRLFSVALAECDRQDRASSDGPSAAEIKGAQPQSTFGIKTTNPEDRVEMKLESSIATLDVSCQSGIGGATITTINGKWPTTVILRLHLGGLEFISASNGKVKLTGSVLSHSGNPRLLDVVEGGKEKKVEKDSPYWTDIQILDANGKPATGLPGKGGCFEITLPNGLLKGEPKSLELGWIDFYRK